MNEQEARAYVDAIAVSRGTLDRLDCFVDLLAAHNRTQNLIAASTLPSIWTRHIADSAQLVPLASAFSGTWIDLGSGPGFPGLVVAAVSGRSTDLIDERAKRAEFLRLAATSLGVGAHVRVHQGRAERLHIPPASVISARAFAPLSRLFAVAASLARPETLWLLPKGRKAAVELEEARATWQGDMRLVPSVTDPDAAIVVATDVRPR